MKVLVTGGAGFIGSHVAEFYANKGHDVVVLDNLSRSELLGKEIKNLKYNWDYLSKFKNISLIKGDIRNYADLEKAAKDANIIIHTAAQTAVTSSVSNPAVDFEVNARGTFNVLEAARKVGASDVSIVYCSTNKVYGNNVNNVEIREKEKRYEFVGTEGITENFSVDLCEHTPYGCSKLTGDLYVQDYAHLHGLKTGVFRMSCIYGTRQFGLEDQGWIAWFTIAAITGKPVTIFGDGKQVRDVLFVKNVVELYDAFINSHSKHGVYNAGGGPRNTLSLLELVGIIERETNVKLNPSFAGWRPSDQKVYVSNISKAEKELGWKPKTSPAEGVRQLIQWVKENKEIF
ncbi:MAG: GDP-mannose 4,6-dehydratase [Candidatus Omnitrophica bacterium]|nr:GDP-mannose 4,6-dehydratase [Candidatus Omnitrophota bacterium]